jgi:hypothetical protein
VLAASSSRPYFINGVVDFALIGGISLVLYAICRTSPVDWTAGIIVGGGVLTLLLNWPHFAATTLRLYGSRSSLRQYPATAVLAPLVSIAAVVGSFVSPLLVAPIFLKVFLLWSPFHYSGQTFGVTMIYARRNRLLLGRWTRSSLSAFIYLSFIAQTAASEVLPLGRDYAGVRIPNFGIPTWSPFVLRSAMLCFAVITLMLLLVDCARARKFPPVMILLPAAAQYVWFVAGANVPSYRALVPAFHSLQYLLIAWSMNAFGPVALYRSRSTRLQLLRRSACWFGMSLAGGALLFWGLPRALGPLGPTPMAAAGIVGACLQVHHFLVDGVIWKLKSRAVVSPLMLSLADVVHPRTASVPVITPEPAL